MVRARRMRIRGGLGSGGGHVCVIDVSLDEVRREGVDSVLFSSCGSGEPFGLGLEEERDVVSKHTDENLCRYVHNQKRWF